MRKFKNLIVVGTSHIAIESVKQVYNIIIKEQPNIIALELDRKRLYALIHNHKRKLHIKDIQAIGIKGFLFNLFGAWAERKLGKIVSTPPGSEMKAAVKAASEVNAKIALIDQDINITLRKLSKQITFREKIKFLKDIIKSTFIKSQKIPFDLRKVPEEKLIKKLTQRVKKEYPTVYNVLIKERNEIMAKALYKLMHTTNKENIVAVVGAGHEADIIQLIKKMK